MIELLDHLPTERLLQVALALALSITAYELLRYAVLGAAGRMMRASVQAFVDRHRVRIDVFKYSGRQLVKEELLNDLEVQEGILVAARAGEPPARARARAEEYIDEISPRFSLTAYFKFGYAVARGVLRLVYRIEIDQGSFVNLKKVPADASVMFLMNHRSNADYLLVAVALAQRVAISFAIGEWARVFPLELLFKLFGGYFLRRNFRDPLYHTVLRRYLQLIVRRGVTQGLFPEGKLTRDGKPGEPKIGLLDAMVAMAAEPGFNKPIVFVPVGLNFDRVLEDAFLLTESDRRLPPTRREKLVSLAIFVGKLPRNVGTALFRLATGRLHRFGYASVSIGEPMSLDAFAATRGMDGRTLAALDKDARRPLVKAFADEMMVRIGRVTPATPVPLTCRALLELGGTATRDALDQQVTDLARRLRAAGTPVIFGRELLHLQTARAELDQATRSDDRRKELAEVDAALIDQEGAEECARIGLARLIERGIVRHEAGVFSIVEDRAPLARYYAWSLAALPTTFREADQAA